MMNTLTSTATYLHECLKDPSSRYAVIGGASYLGLTAYGWTGAIFAASTTAVYSWAVSPHDSNTEIKQQDQLKADSAQRNDRIIQGQDEMDAVQHPNSDAEIKQQDQPKADSAQRNDRIIQGQDEMKAVQPPSTNAEIWQRGQLKAEIAQRNGCTIQELDGMDLEELLDTDPEYFSRSVEVVVRLRKIESLKTAYLTSLGIRDFHLNFGGEFQNPEYTPDLIVRSKLYDQRDEIIDAIAKSMPFDIIPNINSQASLLKQRFIGSLKVTMSKNPANWAEEIKPIVKNAMDSITLIRRKEDFINQSSVHIINFNEKVLFKERLRTAINVSDGTQSWEAILAQVVSTTPLPGQSK